MRAVHEPRRCQHMLIQQCSLRPFSVGLSFSNRISQTEMEFLSCGGREEPCLLDHSVYEHHLPRAIHHGIHTAPTYFEGGVEL